MHLGASPFFVVPSLPPGQQFHTANPVPPPMPVPQIAPQQQPQAVTAFQAIPFPLTRPGPLIIQPPQIGVNITTQRSFPLPQATWQPQAQLMWQPMHQAPFTRVGHQWQMRSSQPRSFPLPQATWQPQAQLMWQPMHQAPFTRVGHQWQMRSSQPAPPNYAHVVRDLGLTVQGVQGMGTLSHVTAAAGHAAPQPAKEAANGPQLSVPQIDPFSRHQCVGTLRVPQLAHALSHVPAPTKALAQPASTAQSYSPPLSINAAVHSYNPMPKPNPAQSKPVGQDARPPLTINAAVHLHEPVPKPKPAAQTPQSKPDGQDARPPLTIRCKPTLDHQCSCPFARPHPEAEASGPDPSEQA
eukprot:s386_g2.t1